MAARRALGNPTSALEQFYESRRWLLWDQLRQDIRFGLRMLAKNPGVSTVAILTLALGIGVNTAVFSVVNAALLKLLPVQNPNELVMLSDPNASMVLGGLLTGDRSLFTYTEFAQLRSHVTTMSGLCASQMLLQRWRVQVSGAAQEEVRGRLVSENYFSVFGVKPALGRFFLQREGTGIGKDPYLVISYDYWQRRFAGNPAVLGTPLRFYRTTFIIIGVAAKSFRGETVGQDPDLWLPMLMQPLVMPGIDALHEDLSRSLDKLMWLHLFGRRKTGVAIAQVRGEVNVLFRAILAAGYPTTMSSQRRKEALNQHIVVRPVRSGAFHGRDEFSEQWTILSVFAGLLLLMACANVANLLLARAAARSRELTIRLSIGADKARLIRQFLTESLLLAALGGAAGIFVAVIALRALLLIQSRAGDTLDLAAHIDTSVLTFTACACLFTGVLFGLAPAFQSTRLAVNQRLKETGRGLTGSRQRATFAKGLVVAQVALSFLLVLGAGLFLRTLQNLQAVALGYPRDNLLLVDIDRSGAGYQAARGVALDQKLVAAFREIPGLRGVTYSDRRLFGFDGAFPINVEGFTSQNEDDSGSTGDFIGPEYFSTIGIPMLLGREIMRHDTAGSRPVCVINEAFASHFFAGRNPIGKHVTSSFSNDHGGSERRSMEVIGVSKAARLQSLRRKIEPKFYAPAEQTGGAFSFEIRTQGDPKLILPAVRQKLLSLDADLSIADARTLNQLLDAENAQPRLITRLCIIFGLLALVLAAAGVYGVLSYSVARRTNEIGIRMALGADKRLVTGMILRETGFMIFLGVIIGLATAAVGARLLSTELYGLIDTGPRWAIAQYERVDRATQLYGVSALDPLTIAIVAGILLLAAYLAAYVPSARASQVDPVQALRHD